MTDTNDLDKAKWMIGRIDQLQKSLMDHFESASSKYESEGNKAISQLKEWRTVGSSAIIGALSIFLTLNSTYPMNVIHSLIIVISAIVGLVAYFILLTKIIAIIEGVISNRNVIVQTDVTTISHSYGYFIARVADLDTIDYPFVKNYFYFVMLLTSAVMVYSAIEFKKLAMHYRPFKDLKNNLLAEARACEKYADLVPYYYGLFDPTKQVPSESLEFIKKYLKDYLPKEQNTTKTQ